jgi:short-subunit dehydrogenase
MDVTDGAVIEQVRKAVRDEFGAIDILVNNAGIVHGGAFLDVPMSAHRRTYEVNTLGLVAVTHAFLPDLVQREDACLVNVASASGFVGLPFGSTYASSKWSVIGFSESIRLELEELGHRHVHVTTVCPSYVATGMFEGARPPMLTPLLSPETVALRIVDAMERGEPFVLEPSLVKSIPLLRGLLPLGLFDRASRVLGLQDSMRHWRGRSSASD